MPHFTRPVKQDSPPPPPKELTLAQIARRLLADMGPLAPPCVLVSSARGERLGRTVSAPGGHVLLDRQPYCVVLVPIKDLTLDIAELALRYLVPIAHILTNRARKCGAERGVPGKIVVCSLAYSHVGQERVEDHGPGLSLMASPEWHRPDYVRIKFEILYGWMPAKESGKEPAAGAG
jgi:hypothetical protein